MEDKVDLMLAAQNFGLDKTWVSDFLSRHGAEALGYVVRALQLGFSKDLVIDLVKWGGGLLVEVLVKLVEDMKPVLGSNGDPLITADPIDLKSLVVKNLIRMLLDNYWDELGKVLRKWAAT